MEKISTETMREYVNNQKFTSTGEVMEAMKDIGVNLCVHTYIFYNFITNYLSSRSKYSFWSWSLNENILP